MAYVYRHIRLDKNVPFYIGIGSDSLGEYKRAHNCGHTRNKHWHNIVNKTKYEVEIIIDGVAWEEALLKEVEFIKIYGRKQFGGTLINLTDGGEGNVGYITSDETKKKQSLKRMGRPAHNKGKPMSKHQLENLISINKGKIPWNKGISPKKESVEKMKKTMEIIGYKKGKDHHRYGVTHSDELKARWKITRKGIPSWNKGISMPNIHLVALNKAKSVSVIRCDMEMNLIEVYRSINEAAVKTGIGKGNISHCCKGNRKSAGGFIWKIKEAETSFITD